MPQRFKDRNDAGRKIVAFLEANKQTLDLIFAIPRGGIEVAAPIARKFGIPLQVVFIRKLPYPFSPEMGFGSIDEKGNILIHPEAEGDPELTPDVVEPIAKNVHEEVLRRKKEFSPYCPDLTPTGKHILLVDDGIATGSSLRAAIHFLKSSLPKEIVIAAGCGYGPSIKKLTKECDEVICLKTQDYGPFAVASYYENFSDRSNEEIKEILCEVNRKWLSSSLKSS